jgi:hypothetical protein
MTSRYRRAIFPNLGAAAVVLLFGCAVMAQEPQPPPGIPPAQEATRRDEGLLDAIGRWFGESAARFSSNMRATREKLDDIGDKASGAAKGAAGAAKGAADVAKDAAKDAADTVARLPSARIIAGRERCTLAPNGAPDCRAAVDAICRGKGFASGKSLDIHSAQKCPARLWLSGRKPDPSECETESFVTRAVCQ